MGRQRIRVREGCCYLIRTTLNAGTLYGSLFPLFFPLHSPFSHFFYSFSFACNIIPSLYSFTLKLDSFQITDHSRPISTTLGHFIVVALVVVKASLGYLGS